MGMGSGGSQQSGTQQTVTKTEPWAGQEPYLTDIFQRAKNISNTPQSYFPASTVVPFSDQTIAGINQAQQIAQSQNPAINSTVAAAANSAEGGNLNAGNPLAQNAFGSFASGQKLNSGNPLAQNTFGSFASGQNLNSGNPIAAQALNQSATGNFLNAGNSTANRALTQTAAGNNLYGGAGFNAAFDAASRKIMPMVNSSAAAAGQTSGDSTARDRLLTETLGDSFANLYGQQSQNQLAAANALNNQYQQERQNQLGSANSLASQYAQQQQNQLSSAGALASQYAQQQQNQLTGANALANQYANQQQNQLASQSLLPQLLQAQYNPSQQLINLGSMIEQMSGQQLQDQINRFNFKQNEPLSRLGAYNALVQGNYGNTQTNVAPLYSNPGAGILGGALGGAKLGSAVPGIGTGIGALAGGLGGLLFG